MPVINNGSKRKSKITIICQAPRHLATLDPTPSVKFHISWLSDVGVVHDALALIGAQHNYGAACFEWDITGCWGKIEFTGCLFQLQYIDPSPHTYFVFIVI